MTNYQKGARAEREFMKWMSANYYPFRMAGSHSEFDIILLPKDITKHIVFCQLKVGKNPPQKPCDEFLNMKVPDNCLRWWVTKKDREDWIIKTF